VLADVHGVRLGRGAAGVLVKSGTENVPRDVDASGGSDGRARSHVGDVDLQAERRRAAAVVAHDAVEDEITRRGRCRGRRRRRRRVDHRGARGRGRERIARIGVDPPELVVARGVVFRAATAAGDE
jgi:hypothetical protein